MTLGDGGHPAAFDAIGAGRDFDTVADAGDGFVVIKKPLGEANEVEIFADVFGSTTAGEEDAEVVLRVDFGEGEVGFELVAFPFLCDGPAGADFVHDHLVSSFFGSDDHGSDAGLLEPVEGIESVEGFGGVADDDEDFWLGGHNIGVIYLGGGRTRSRCRWV